MNHLERSHDFVNKINELIYKFHYEFNTHTIRSQICCELKSLFIIEFDEYWQKISGLHPSDFNFLDNFSNVTASDMINYSGPGHCIIGVSIKNGDLIPFLDFINEYFGKEAVRDRKIKDLDI